MIPDIDAAAKAMFGLMDNKLALLHPNAEGDFSWEAQSEELREDWRACARKCAEVWGLL